MHNIDVTCVVVVEFDVSWAVVEFNTLTAERNAFDYGRLLTRKRSVGRFRLQHNPAFGTGSLTDTRNSIPAKLMQIHFVDGFNDGVLKMNRTETRSNSRRTEFCSLKPV